MSDDSSPAPDTIGDALRAVQAHFEGEDDPVFADLCDLVNRAAEEHARTPDRTPQLDMANAEIERLAAALRAERAAWQEASGADSPGELTAAVNAHRARRTAELAARAPAVRPSIDDCPGCAKVRRKAAQGERYGCALHPSAPADASRPGLTEEQADALADEAIRLGFAQAAHGDGIARAPISAAIRRASRGSTGLTEEQNAWERLRRVAAEIVDLEYEGAFRVSDSDAIRFDELRAALAAAPVLRASRGETGPAHPLEWTCPKCGQRAVGLGARQSPELGCERCGHVERPAADLGPGVGGAPIRVRPTAARSDVQFCACGAAVSRGEDHPTGPGHDVDWSATDRQRATLHAGDPASLADVVAASAREPHADVVLQALHVSGGAAAIGVESPVRDPRVDYSTDMRPAVTGGECSRCLHAPPLHEATCPTLRRPWCLKCDKPVETCEIDNGLRLVPRSLLDPVGVPVLGDLYVRATCHGETFERTYTAAEIREHGMPPMTFFGPPSAQPREPAVLGGRGYLSTGDRFRDQLAGDRHVEAGGCKDPACEWCDNDAPAPRLPREP